MTKAPKKGAAARRTSPAKLSSDALSLSVLWLRRQQPSEAEELAAWARVAKNAAYVVGRLAAAGVAPPLAVDISTHHDLRSIRDKREPRADIHVIDVAEVRLRVFGAARMPALEREDREDFFLLRGVRVFSVSRGTGCMGGV